LDNRALSVRAVNLDGGLTVSGNATLILSAGTSEIDKLDLRARLDSQGPLHLGTLWWSTGVMGGTGSTQVIRDAHVFPGGSFVFPPVLTGARELAVGGSSGITGSMQVCSGAQLRFVGEVQFAANIKSDDCAGAPPGGHVVVD